MGKSSDVLNFLDRSFIIIHSTPPQFGRGASHDLPQITVHLSSAKSLSYSRNPFRLYREIALTLKVFNACQDTADNLNCFCCPYSTGMTRVVPSGTSLNQLSDIIRQRHCIVSRKHRPVVNTKVDMDANCTPLSNGTHASTSAPPAYQSVVGHENGWNNHGNGRPPPPCYGACQEALPLYSSSYARHHM